jgi:glycerol-3-phosphate acyltransferase PlsX
MGADGGPQAIIEGGLDAARRLGEAIHVKFVGHQEMIKKVLDHIRDLPKNISVHHAESEVTMLMAATDGVKMRDSSIAVGLQAHKRGLADAFVSPGNTGAVMATALLTLGRIEGVSRPAITAVFPSSGGRPCVVLDVGANAECKPQHLAQFAVMGSVYSSILFNIEAPRVGLMSIGEERSKGNELILAAQQQLLKSTTVNFVGNIEGRDVMSGNVDVAVTDGFTGNVLLKYGESVQPFLMNAIRRQIQTNIFSRIGVYLLAPFLRRIKNSFDYAEAGGAPLLGVNGIVIICHGSSNARAIYNAVRIAFEMHAKRIKQRIHDELITNHFGKNNGSKDKREDHGNGIVHTASADDQR